MPPDPVEYRSPETQSPRTSRPLRKWLILLLVWLVGLIVWALYWLLAAVVLLKIL